MNIKRCPFDASEVEFKSDSLKRFWYAFCPACGLLTISFPSKEKLETYWNTRKAEPRDAEEKGLDSL